MKKALIVVAVVLGVLVLAGGALMLRFRVMSLRMSNELVDVRAVDLAAIPDGMYVGEYGDFLVAARVAVSVAGGRIVAIDMLAQQSGPGYGALEILDRIVEGQSPQVDVVSGASGSSKAIMIAVYRALSGEE